MKYAVLALGVWFVLMAAIPDASAVVCARGVHRAGCVGPRGAAVVHRGCRWVRGVRVC
jgi:hypothetical protein